MVHLLFVALHGMAALFFLPALFVTVPLHCIYGLVAGRKTEPSPTPRTHVRCPDCKEFVLKEARRCKHCGCVLVPESEQR